MDSLTPHTIHDLLTVYERDYLPHFSTNHQYQQRLYYRRFRREMGDILLTQVTPVFVRTWRRHLEAHYRASTVCRYMDALSAPLRAAVTRYRWLAEHPFGALDKPREPKGRLRFLSDQERNALLLQCQLSVNPHLYLLVLLALTTGGRKNELRYLRWQDVDLQRGRVAFLATKNGEPRGVPVTGQGLALLTQRGVDQPGTAWVFPRRDGRAPILMEQAWTTARKRAGLVDFHFHDLRHTAASYLAMSGASLMEIGAILGHKNHATTRRYIHLVEQHLGGVVDRMTAQFRM